MKNRIEIIEDVNSTRLSCFLIEGNKHSIKKSMNGRKDREPA